MQHFTVTGLTGWGVDHGSSATEVSGTVIGNWRRDPRVRVCRAAVEVPAAGSLPEPGPVVRSGPYS